MSHDITIDDESTKRLLYSYIGIRILVYGFFLIINVSQSIIEFKVLLKKRSNHATRFFIFLSMSFFCCFRVIASCLFYNNQYLGLGSVSFFFFSLGTICVFLQWVFITQHWLLIMYSFFISDDIRINRTNPIKYTTFIFALILIVYQVTISICSLVIDVKFTEGIMFLILLLIYASGVFINGSILLRHLKQHKKHSQYESCFRNMIFKTKVLLVTLVLVFVIIIAEEMVFQFGIKDTYDTPLQYLKLFITGTVDTLQMFVVLLVIANGRFINYILFKKVKTTSLSSSSDDSSSIKNTKKNTPSNISGKSFSVEVEMDSSVNSSNVDKNSATYPSPIPNQISTNNIIISSDNNLNTDSTDEIVGNNQN